MFHPSHHSGAGRIEQEWPCQGSVAWWLPPSGPQVQRPQGGEKKEVLWCPSGWFPTHHSLSTSLYLMLHSKQLGTEFCQINTSVIFRSESQRSWKRPEFPSWDSELDDSSNRFFSQSELVFFFWIPSCFKCTEVGDFRVPSSQLFWMWHYSWNGSYERPVDSKVTLRAAEGTIELQYGAGGDCICQTDSKVVVVRWTWHCFQSEWLDRTLQDFLKVWLNW